jgi:hypothetical protein
MPDQSGERIADVPGAAAHGGVLDAQMLGHLPLVAALVELRVIEGDRERAQRLAIDLGRQRGNA